MVARGSLGKYKVSGSQLYICSSVSLSKETLASRSFSHLSFSLDSSAGTSDANEVLGSSRVLDGVFFGRRVLCRNAAEWGMEILFVASLSYDNWNGGLVGHQCDHEKDGWIRQHQGAWRRNEGTAVIYSVLPFRFSSY
jgi:hypothetical protein